MQQTWHPTSWSTYPNSQVLPYKSSKALDAVLKKLQKKPPLVAIQDIENLKQLLKKASTGACFILQAGDCAESFQNARPANLRAQLNLMQRIKTILETTLNQPIVSIGRIAGQYAKPRSSHSETIDNLTLPSYRGDLINTKTFHEKAREPDPDLLLKGYAAADYTLRFIKSIQKNTAFYTSHEALHLPYETALTRCYKQKKWYNTSTHLPWVGVRTSQIDGAHIEYLSGIQNPIGIKVGPDTTPDILLTQLNKLNPNQIEGRILLITRLGRNAVQTKLPPLIDAIKTHQLPVTWSCDPMHGNTEITQKGIKTRRFLHILDELLQTQMIHNAQQSILGGIHLELTPEPVTECLGGKDGPTEQTLETAYTSLLDPRLNQAQALEIVRYLKKASKKTQK